MKIRINREIEVPDRLICAGARNECPALGRKYDKTGNPLDIADCMNFNRSVF